MADTLHRGVKTHIWRMAGLPGSNLCVITEYNALRDNNVNEQMRIMTEIIIIFKLGESLTACTARQVHSAEK